MKNTILFTLVAIVAAAAGTGILRYFRGLPGRVAFLLNGLGHILLVIGFFLTGTLIWAYFSGQFGPATRWFQSPAFYLAAALWVIFALGWFWRPLDRTGRGIAWRVGYPILLVLPVIGCVLMTHYIDKREDNALEGALLAAREHPAPEIPYLNGSGEARALSEFKGKVVLVNFWMTTCGPCVFEMPALSALQTKFRDRGFVLVCLSPESPEVQAKFFQGRNLGGIHGRTIPEKPVPDFYTSGNAWPISFLIDRGGIVKEAWVGAMPAEWVEEKIQQRL